MPGRLENVVGQASRLPFGRLAPVFSRARRPFIAGRRPAPLFFKHALSAANPKRGFQPAQFLLGSGGVGAGDEFVPNGAAEQKRVGVE